MMMTTWIEIRTLRERLGIKENELNNDIFGLSNVAFNETSNQNRQVVPHNSTSFDNPNESLIHENDHLKQRIDEFVSNEKNLIEINEDLQRQIHELLHKENTNNDEALVSNSIHMEQINSLTKEVEQIKKKYSDLREKSEYDKHELQTIIEQLRDDTIDLDKTKQLYIDVCHEKNTIEDKLRAKFEQEIKIKLDDLHRTLDKEYNDKFNYYKNNFEQDNQTFKKKYQQDLEQQIKESNQEIERIKINHEKTLNALNIELDRFRANDDAKNRLAYVEKEFEQLKHDYSDLNQKQKELLNTCKTLEDENQNLLQTIEQLDQEKIQLKETYENLEEKYSNEIVELNELIEEQKQELNSLSKQTNDNQIDLKQNVEALQTRIHNYENAVSQYEEYRIKLENNLQKITQQRDTNKMDLKLTKEMLTNKENEFNQTRLRFEDLEKNLQLCKERLMQNESTNNDLQIQINQYEQRILELNQNKSKDIQEKEVEYREKFVLCETEKKQYEQRIQELNRALNLADSHLKQEIEKIKTSLEQEYSRRYERDQKQHQNDLNQLQQQLTSEFEKQKSNIPIVQNNTALQEIEEVKKMYRTEIDRLYRENIELSQNQAKLIDTHQKQMQIMKKDLDDGYNNVINEFQHEQQRLQTRCEQLKQQLNDSQRIHEQLKKSHSDEIIKLKEKYNLEQDQKNRQENLQNRVDHLVKLLEKSNEALNQEREVHAKQENEYQQTISTLQKKIADMIKQHTKAMDEIKRELHQERLSLQRQTSSRPICVPEFVQTDLSLNNMRSDYMATVEKLRELLTIEMLALLRLTCKMIFDVHHRVGIAHYMDNLDSSIKKQIQNELIRSRNSMIKEIRRELFEKMTQAMKSQGVPDTTIDMHVFELDRLLSQMAQDCLDSLSSSPSTASCIYSTMSTNSSLTTPQRQLARSIIYDSSTSSANSSKSKTPETNYTPLRKSTEYLHLTPIPTKQVAPLAPHCHVTLDNNRRPKSASTILLANQNSTTPNTQSIRTHKFQRPNNRNFKMKMYRSEDDITLAVNRHNEKQQQTSDLNASNLNNDDEDKNNNDDDDDDDDTITICENDREEQIPQPNVRALARQFEQKTNSLPDHIRSKSKTLEYNQTIHFATARTIINEKYEENDDEELTWPQQPLQTPTQSSGLKKFVRNGLKLFTTQSQQQQQSHNKKSPKN